MKTWRELVAIGADYLSQKGVPDAAVAMEELMGRLLGCGRGFLEPHFQKIPSERYVAAMRRAMSRLVAGEPLQYVLGEWDFRRLTLKCDRRALIPRPETEELVTRALAFLNARSADLPPPVVVDVGTGSGCIVLSLAREFGREAAFLGLDVSSAAVSLATENAVKCGLEGKVKFVVADGLDDFDEPQSVDMIVSNPPYVSTAECETLDPRIRDFEPRSALDGGAQGLDFYERFISDALNLLKPGGAVFFEIGDGQGEAVRKLFFDAGFDDIKIEKDYAGHDRYASAVLP